MSLTDDGTKMYVIGFATLRINQYNLATAWDLSDTANVENDGSENFSGTETRSRAIDNTPSDFVSMDTFLWEVQCRVVSRVDDTFALAIRVVNGATILAAANSGGTFTVVSSSVTSSTNISIGPTAFAYVNTAANKTTWDGASVEVQVTFTQQMGPDGASLVVEHVVFTGTYTPSGPTNETLDGVLFQRAPSFFVGVVEPGTATVVGVLFQRAPTFFVADIATDATLLDGVLYQNTPTFFAGTVAPGAANITGVLYENTPTFFAGDITTLATLQGVLFTSAPGFQTGSIDALYQVDGILFQGTPIFSTGVVTYDQALAGSLFLSTPFFGTGVVAEEGFVVGSTFQSAPVFGTGSVTPGSVDIAGVLFQRAPTFFVGSAAVGASTVIGTLFQVVPNFNTGTVDAGPVLVQGITLTVAPAFSQGTVGASNDITGAFFQRTPTFPAGQVLLAPSFIVADLPMLVVPLFPTGFLIAPSVIDQRPWEFAYFARDNEGNLRYILHEPQVRIRPPGSRVTSTFRFNRTNYDRSYIDAAVDDAWEANKAASVPDLQDALHAALSAAGVKNRHGQTLA